MRFKSKIHTYNGAVIGLERDGVVNIKNKYGVATPRDFIPIPGSLEAIALMRSKGHRIVFISDQSGIFKNYYTEDDVSTVNKHMLELLGRVGCPSIDGIFFSLSSEKKDFYAKPNVGMFEKAEKELGVNFSEGWYVGHTMKDLKVANKIGSRPVLVRTGDGVLTERELGKYSYHQIRKRTAVFHNLLEFAQSL